MTKFGVEIQGMQKMSKLVIGSEKSLDELDDWTSSSTVSVTARKKRTRASAPINIELFAKCAKETIDPFWQKILIQAQGGKFPSKFGYKAGFLQYKQGQKIEQIPLSLVPKIAVKEFITFIQDKSSIYSDMDKKKTAELKSKMNTVIVTSWSKMKKKEQKQSISEYIERHRRLYKLTPREIQQFKYTLNYGFALKYFHKDNIIVNDYIITNIKGLVFSSKTRTFYVDKTVAIPQKRTASKRVTQKEIKAFDERWFTFHAKIISDALSIHGLCPKKKKIKIVRHGSGLRLANGSSEGESVRSRVSDCESDSENGSACT